MSEESKRIIEVNGVKLEVDLSSCRRIDEFKIGDNVKVLKKKEQYSGEEIFNGVIVDFLNFKDLPVIQIAVFERGYNSCQIKFLNYNSTTNNIDIVKCGEHELTLEKCKMQELMQNEIDSIQAKADELRNKLGWFLKFYGQYFEKKESEINAVRIKE